MKAGKLIALIGIIATITIIAGFFLLNEGKQNKALQQEGIEAEGRKGIDRGNYGISASVFSELPQAPKDFNKVVELFYAGKISAGYLNEDYYKQPEFLRNFSTIGLQYWIRPDAERWQATGFGWLPTFQKLYLISGQSRTARVFFHCSFGVQSFQGMRVSAEIPEKLKGNAEIEITPEQFLLEPCFPKFWKNWMIAVDVNIKVSQLAPEGSHAIKLALENPESAKSSEWSEKYKSQYFDSLSLGSASEKPVIMLEIQ